MQKTIFWFRQDLRLSDNPGLFEAAKTGALIPVYILDDAAAGEFKMGGASRWWLHHSLEALNASLDGKLNIYAGDSREILAKLVAQHDVRAIYWNRCYEPWRIRDDSKIKKEFQNIECKSFNGSLLWEPFDILKNDGTPYKVFTPFYKKGCLGAEAPRKPLSSPELKLCDTVHREDLGLLPHIKWDEKMHWEIGEEAAQKRLNTFISKGLGGYKEGRNYPSWDNVSRLSPHLHFGEISPNQVWYGAQNHMEGPDLDHFLSELGWREFSYSLLYHFPHLPRKNFQEKFDRFPWEDNPAFLKAWQKGQTGYPIVDAGMRELWQTGYMHNRVRMIVGSFLVKNLLLHWHHGEDWFWDCLVDADLASNSASWQWIAGSGADAAPYFRVFNPILQGEKFDEHGEYTKKFVPELKGVPSKYLFNPWEAPEWVLKEAGVVLGQTYPKPIVSIEDSRNLALAAFKTLS
jgi:deoxyribodipyrimidine photo-lyase